MCAASSNRWHVVVLCLVAMLALRALVTAQVTSPLAPVRVGNNWQFCDKQGNIVLPPKSSPHEWIDAYPFYGGYARVKGRNGKWVLISPDCKYACIRGTQIPIVGLQMRDVSAEGFVAWQATARDNGWSCTEASSGNTIRHGFYVSQFSSGIALVREEKPQTNRPTLVQGYFVDATGKTLQETEAISMEPFSDSLAKVTFRRRTNVLEAGFINCKLEMLIPAKPAYVDSGPFVCGLTQVRTPDGKLGYIDRDEKEVIPARFEDAATFSEGLARVRMDGKYGFIDTKGEIVIPCTYYDASSFANGLAGARDKWGKWGVIDKTGKLVVEYKYDDLGTFSQGLARIRIGRKWGYIDTAGIEVISPRFDEVRDFTQVQ